MPVDDPVLAEAPTALHATVEEARRMLTICNACRYCEGYCAVFPALARRRTLTAGDVTQLANLCHDCRACFDACMYAPPHPFAVNPPKALSQVRLESYDRHVWPHRVPRLLRGWLGVFSGSVVSAAVLLVIALAHVGPAGLVADPEDAASPYQVIAYPVLLVVILLPALFAVVVLFDGGRRYWRDIGGTPENRDWPAVIRAVGRAAGHALTLRYLRGGGGECFYPRDDEPSAARRRLHVVVVSGFALCVVSTASAAVMQDIIGVGPPYPVFSVPVVAGLFGGVGLVAGCAGLLRLKARASHVTSVAQMTIKDYGLLVALGFLGVSGLVTFLFRDSRAFGPVLVIHLAAVVLAFASAPYSKFAHVVYRFLALVRDNLELDGH